VCVCVCTRMCDIVCVWMIQVIDSLLELSSIFFCR